MNIKLYLSVTLDYLYGFILGMQDSAKWNSGTESDDVPSISYSHEERNDIVKLVCSTDRINRLEMLGESPKNTYTFRLTHQCACWNGCGGKRIGRVFSVSLLLLCHRPYTTTELFNQWICLHVGQTNYSISSFSHCHQSIYLITF